MDHQLQREIESFIEAYEDACQHGLLPVERLTEFLPEDIYSELYRQSSVELIRVDMELRWNEFAGSPIDTYRRLFPHLLADAKILQVLEFERGRLEASNNTTDLPLQDSLRRLTDNVATASRDFQNLSTTFPVAGDRFAEFELFEEIGRGAFGVVFIAQQAELANRTVVLKISPISSIESDRLAQLQHTNIVPIFSIHREGPLQAICMPLLGRSTLANAISNGSTSTRSFVSAQDFISTIKVSPEHRTTPNTSLNRNTRNTNTSSDAAGTDPTTNRDRQRTTNRDGVTPDLIEGVFRDLNYVHAIVWMIHQVAEGLSHAHARGVLHLDVKPANILIGDDSIPRLLDFHVSTEYKSNETIQVVHGGTMPYMSKEHMDAFLGIGKVDARADIFSLGVVLYQLLCNELPFPQPSGSIEQMYSAMVKDRSLRPRTDRFHPQASAGLIDITLRCIAPYDQRYQSMPELLEDLRRHLNHRPLKHAPNSSLKELGTKFCRRHPTATSTSSLVSLAAILIAFLIYGWWNQTQRSAQSEAALYAEQLHRAIKKQRLDFVGSQLGIDTPPVDANSTITSVAGMTSPAMVNPSNLKSLESDWAKTLQHLPVSQRTQFIAELSESMYLQRLQSEQPDSPTPTTHESSPTTGQSMPIDVSTVLSGIPPGAIQQFSAIDDQWTKTQSILRAKASLYRSLKGRQSGWISQIAKEINLLESLDATDPSLALFRAMAARNQGEYRDAEMHYWTFLSIDPEATEAYLFRGFARLEAGRNLDALSDFERVLQRWPNWTPVMINAAIACQKINNHPKAIEYLNRALQIEPNRVQPLVLRSRSRFVIKDIDGSKQDQLDAIRSTPTTANEWVMRGVERLQSDLEGAVSDFQQALAIEPSNFEALQNLAHVFSDRKPDLGLAQQYLSKAIEARPSDTIALVSRGVLFARLGDRQAALRDAAIAEERSSVALVHYQIACIHSLLSNQDKPSEFEAIIGKHLSQAFIADGSLIPVATQDPDLAKARNLPDIKRILGAAHYIQSTASPAPPKNTLAPSSNAESSNSRASNP